MDMVEKNQSHSLMRSVLLALILTTVMFESSAQSVYPSTIAGRSTVYSPNGPIATSHPLASGAGLQVLQEGGNAVDAAVTAAAVLGVVEPHMTGIGGDMFAIMWLAEEDKLLGMNGSGRAGSLMTLDEMKRRGHDAVPIEGAEPVTVPGALAGWAELLASHGTISLERALSPAIAIARDGFPVSPLIAAQWAEEFEKLKRNVEASRVYLVDGQRAPIAGEWFANSDLADTYQAIADDGIDAFYGGEIGQRIVDHLSENGGFVTLDDLRNHRIEWIEPVSVPYKGYRLWELPPNGQGIAALEMLRILEPYDLAGMGHNSPQYLHHLVEAKKLAYADLAYFVADPDYMNVSVDDMLSDRFILSRRAELNSGQASEQAEPGELVTKSDTIYLAAADKDGNMISFINSVSWEFGSGVVVPGTGFALQNRGTGFTLEEGMANTLAAGKRPFHTLIPAFVTRTGAEGRDEPWLSFGVMGGSMQPQGHIQVLLNLLVFEMDLQDAIDAPRVRHISGLDVALEAPFSEVVRAGLRSLGHNLIAWNPHWFGGAQAVMKLERGWASASDPRKDGMAVGH
jgi:gamma-glutamyltranspeptidase/glutathione hydrolase